MKPWALLASALLVSCTAEFSGTDEAAIRAVMAEQEAAWDRGDIPGFMRGYAQDVCFHSKRGPTCGKEAVTANYLKHYPDKAAMGDLTFGIEELLPAGPNNAWLSGTWQLYRERDTVGGVFVLFWRKEADGWRIVRDHTD